MKDKDPISNKGYDPGYDNDAQREIAGGLRSVGDCVNAIRGQRFSFLEGSGEGTRIAGSSMSEIACKRALELLHQEPGMTEETAEKRLSEALNIAAQYNTGDYIPRQLLETTEAFKYTPAWYANERGKKESTAKNKVDNPWD